MNVDDLPIVDAHLDLAFNALNGRDLRLSAIEIREKEARTDHQCMVTIPEMSRGGVSVAFGSIFVSPTEFPETTEHEFDPAMGEKAKEEVATYQSWEDKGLVRIIRGRESLDSHLRDWESDRKPGILIAMESADPISSPDELEWWFSSGVRMIGPAWGPTRYCGGYAGPRGQATGFTTIGRELLAGMADFRVPLDLAHMSVESFWEGVEWAAGAVVCTHTTPRELMGIERLPDAEMIKALAGRGGIVGIGLGNVFLDRSWWGERDRNPVTLEAAGRVFGHIAQVTGWDHTGIGSDLDGGIGVEESPAELDTIADERKLADVLPEEAVAGVLGGNWLRFLRSSLPD